MGFNSSFTGREQNLENETLEYLQSRPEVANAMTTLMLELKRIGRNKKSPDSGDGIKIGVTNQHGQKLAVTVIGVNSTSLISSEMEGQLTFTFIKNISSLEFYNENTTTPEMSKERNFILIKG